jgi:hypothetical protein
VSDIPQRRIPYGKNGLGRYLPAVHYHFGLRSMAGIELTEEEGKVLEFVLKSYLSDLSLEIADTDRLDLRDHLKERKVVISSILDRVRKLARPDSRAARHPQRK